LEIANYLPKESERLFNDYVWPRQEIDEKVSPFELVVHKTRKILEMNADSSQNDTWRESIKALDEEWQQFLCLVMFRQCPGMSQL
jgi:hypothetical protein